MRTRVYISHLNVCVCHCIPIMVCINTHTEIKHNIVDKRLLLRTAHAWNYYDVISAMGVVSHAVFNC